MYILISQADQRLNLLSSKKDIDDHIFSGQSQDNFQVISATPIYRMRYLGF